MAHAQGLPRTARPGCPRPCRPCRLPAPGRQSLLSHMVCVTSERFAYACHACTDICQPGCPRRAQRTRGGHQQCDERLISVRSDARCARFEVMPLCRRVVVADEHRAVVRVLHVGDLPCRSSCPSARLPCSSLGHAVESCMQSGTFLKWSCGKPSPTEKQARILSKTGGRAAMSALVLSLSACQACMRHKRRTCKGVAVAMMHSGKARALEAGYQLLCWVGRLSNRQIRPPLPVALAHNRPWPGEAHMNARASACRP